MPSEACAFKPDLILANQLAYGQVCAARLLLVLNCGVRSAVASSRHKTQSLWHAARQDCLCRHLL